MNILICGGTSEADYVLSAFKKSHNRIVVMNDNDETADLLSEHYDLDVIKVDPTKIYSFEEADVTNFDLVVALLERDADNFVVCQIAKRLFHIKKAICTVNNPNNVAIFQRLGIDSPISSSYLLTQQIKGESDVESIFSTLSLENERIVITEIKILKEFPCCGQNLIALQLPRTGNITCIFREPEVIIPRGDTIITEGDTLVIASSPNNQQDLIDYIKNGPDNEEIKRRAEAAAIQKQEDARAAEEAAKVEMERENELRAQLTAEIEEKLSKELEQKESLLRKQIEAEIRNELVQEYHSNYVDDEDEDDTAKPTKAVKSTKTTQDKIPAVKDTNTKMKAVRKTRK
jgi:trk system potassium uptake protein TrkA